MCCSVAARTVLAPGGGCSPVDRHPSCVSRTRSCADNAASTNPVFIRPNRTRCSTTTVVARGSANSWRTWRRVPFIPDPYNQPHTNRRITASRIDYRALIHPQAPLSITNTHYLTNNRDPK